MRTTRTSSAMASSILRSCSGSGPAEASDSMRPARCSPLSSCREIGAEGRLDALEIQLRTGNRPADEGRRDGVGIRSLHHQQARHGHARGRRPPRGPRPGRRRARAAARAVVRRPGPRHRSSRVRPRAGPGRHGNVRSARKGSSSGGWQHKFYALRERLPRPTSAPHRGARAPSWFAEGFVRCRPAPSFHGGDPCVSSLARGLHSSRKMPERPCR